MAMVMLRVIRMRGWMLMAMVTLMAVVTRIPMQMSRLPPSR